MSPNGRNRRRLPPLRRLPRFGRMPSVGVVPSRDSSVESDTETFANNFQGKKSLSKSVVFTPHTIHCEYSLILVHDLIDRFPLRFQILPEQSGSSFLKNVVYYNTFPRWPGNRLPMHRGLLNGLKGGVSKLAERFKFVRNLLEIDFIGLNRYKGWPPFNVQQRPKTDHIHPFNVDLKIIRNAVLYQAVKEIYSRYLNEHTIGAKCRVSLSKIRRSRSPDSASHVLVELDGFG